MGLFKIVLLIGVIGLGLAGWKVIGPSGGGGWGHDIDDGLAAARRSGKPMLVFYTADWCPPCRQLKSTVLREPTVIAYLEETYVLVKIDITNRRGPNATIAAEHKVTSIPTMIVFSPRGTEKNRIAGGGALDIWLRRFGRS